MPDKPTGDQDSQRAKSDPKAAADEAKPTPVEPREAGPAAVAPNVEQKNADEHSGTTQQYPSISEQAFVDRVKKSDRWMIALTAVIAFGGAVSAGIFWQQLNAMQGQLNAMRADARAWVILRNIELVDFAVGNPLKFNVLVENIGKEPAVDAVTHQTLWKGTDPNAFNAKMIEISKNWWSECKSQTPGNGSDVIFPAPGQKHQFTITLNTPVESSLLNGNEALIFAGCIIYKSMDAPRHTSFCRAYRQGDATPTQWIGCFAGEYAD